jgi:hypothetical protein
MVNGTTYSAMAGCYNQLTKDFSKTDKEKYFQTLAEKQAKDKDLNGWDKNILRLLQYKKENKYSEKLLFYIIKTDYNNFI